MKNPTEGFFFGATGEIVRKWDLQERRKMGTLAPLPEMPSQADKTRVSSQAISHPELSRKITSLHRLAVLYHSQRKYAQAERLYQEVLVMFRDAVGPNHLNVARCLNNLARLYYEQERYTEAEPLYKRSLAIVEESLGGDHPKFARRLANLAELYCDWGKHAEADALYQRAVTIEEKAFGLNHPNTLKSQRAYAAMLRKMNATAKAEAMEARIKDF